MGCYNRPPETGGLERQAVISHSSGSWKSTIKVLADPMSGENPLGFVDSCLLVESSHGERREEVISVTSLLIRERIPSWGLHLHDWITSQKPCLLIPSPWVLGFQSKNLGRTQTGSPSYLPRGPLPWHSCGPSPGSQKQVILQAAGRLVGYCGKRVRRPGRRSVSCSLLAATHTDVTTRVVVPAGSADLQSRLSWAPCDICRHWSPFHGKSTRCAVRWSPLPAHSRAHGLRWESEALPAWPWLTHCSAPLPPRPPSNLALQLFQSTTSSLNTPCPPPPLQLCQRHVFFTASSSSRWWRDERTRPRGKEVMAVLTMWN